MSDRNKIIELLEHEVRWYYRAPILTALTGLVIVIIFAINSEHEWSRAVRFTGAILFFIGLGMQCMLGFENIGFRWKSRNTRLEK